MSIAALLILAATLTSPLSAFDNHVGHCWVAQIDEATVDRHCFHSVFNGAHVRDEHVVLHKGQRVYSGDTVYSVAGGRMVFTYWNSLGGVGHGTMVTRGDEMLFDLGMRATPTARLQKIRTIWRRTSDGYDAVTDGQVRHFQREQP